MAHVGVVRSTRISADPETIFPLVTNFRQWLRWSPYEKLDENLHREYRGPDSGVGAEYGWSGNAKAGSGVMQITAVTEDRVDITLEFIKPFKGTSRHAFSIVPADGTSPEAPLTEVTWAMNAEQKGLMGLVGKYLMPMEKMMGPAFEQGLADLKREAEAEQNGGSATV